jgi:hypothetical protein
MEPLLPMWIPIGEERRGHFPRLEQRHNHSFRQVRPTYVHRENTKAAYSFYARLQVFFLDECPVVIQMDTSDMLPLRPFLANVVAAATEHGFAASELCPYTKYAYLRHGLRYFNAGLFAIGPSYLAQAVSGRLFAEMMLMTRSPPCADTREPRSWSADQSLLNIAFQRKEHTTLDASYNHMKRYEACGNLGAPRVLHYVGGKPWVNLSLRPSSDLRPWVLRYEQLWWKEYFRDKTVVVGAGPSVRVPFGAYIDMFTNVARINGFDLTEFNATGRRTTHLFFHKATAGSTSFKAALARVPRETRFLAPFNDTSHVLNARMQRSGGIHLTVGQVTVLDSFYYGRLMADMRAAKRGAQAPRAMHTPAATHEEESHTTHPLTGTIAIAWCLRNIRSRPIYFIGFDMTIGKSANDGSYLKKHYEPSRVRTTNKERPLPWSGSIKSLKQFHDIASEKAYLSALVAEGEIAQLDSLPLT